MVAVCANGELIGVDRIIPGVLMGFLLTSASRDTGEGTPWIPRETRAIMCQGK